MKTLYACLLLLILLVAPLEAAKKKQGAYEQMDQGYDDDSAYPTAGGDDYSADYSGSGDDYGSTDDYSYSGGDDYSDDYDTAGDYGSTNDYSHDSGYGGGYEEKEQGYIATSYQAAKKSYFSASTTVRKISYLSKMQKYGCEPFAWAIYDTRYEKVIKNYKVYSHGKDYCGMNYYVSKCLSGVKGDVVYGKWKGTIEYVRKSPNYCMVIRSHSNKNVYTLVCWNPGKYQLHVAAYYYKAVSVQTTTTTTTSLTYGTSSYYEEMAGWVNSY